jgi:uncharacterized protein with HEPN domain
MRTVLDRLWDIDTAIERIDAEATHGRAAFDADPKVQVWMLYHIQLIGEAVRAVSEELKALSPLTPWAQIIGMRHILVHNYFGVDLDQVWNVAINDLRPLKLTVTMLLQSIGHQAAE